MTDDPKFQTIKTAAHTIGVQTLNQMLHEYHGRHEEAEKVKEQIERQKNHLEQLIKLYYNMVSVLPRKEKNNDKNCI